MRNFNEVHLQLFFVVDPRIFVVLNPLFVQIKHTDYCKTVGATIIILNDFNSLKIL